MIWSCMLNVVTLISSIIQWGIRFSSALDWLNILYPRAFYITDKRLIMNISDMFPSDRLWNIILMKSLTETVINERQVGQCRVTLLTDCEGGALQIIRHEYEWAVPTIVIMKMTIWFKKWQLRISTWTFFCRFKDERIFIRSNVHRRIIYA